MASEVEQISVWWCSRCGSTMRYELDVATPPLVCPWCVALQVDDLPEKLHKGGAAKPVVLSLYELQQTCDRVYALGIASGRDAEQQRIGAPANIHRGLTEVMKSLDRARREVIHAIQTFDSERPD